MTDASRDGTAVDRVLGLKTCEVETGSRVGCCMREESLGLVLTKSVEVDATCRLEHRPNPALDDPAGGQCPQSPTVRDGLGLIGTRFDPRQPLASMASGKARVCEPMSMVTPCTHRRDHQGGW